MRAVSLVAWFVTSGLGIAILAELIVAAARRSRTESAFMILVAVGLLAWPVFLLRRRGGPPGKSAETHGRVHGGE